MSADVAGLQVRPLKRVEYDRLVDAGVFEGEPIELLDGALVEMSPEDAPHTWVIQEITRVLTRGVSDDLRVRVGHPWAANDISEPEPDLAVVPHDDYRTEHAANAVLVIEVAHSSRRKDLGIKARIYGAAGVPEYWVIDLREKVVHRHTLPTATGYDRVERIEFAATLDAAGVAVCLADVLAAP